MEGILLKNYLKVTFRNLIKHKGFSLINIAGPALGITVCLVIILFLADRESAVVINERALALLGIADPQDAV